MKRNQLLTIVFLVLCEVVCSQAEKQKLYNADSAKIDFSKGKPRWLIYGPKFNVSPCRQAASKKYGFEYFQAYGCEISKEIMSGLEAYNSEMQILLIPRNGKEWHIKCEKEIELCQKKTNR